ncbi:chemotaxis protein CheW [Geomonas sp. Red32]|uniref:chemotaxis protein CheW n=1 Tax=Geomonas sp. Red32 TaxID=2912856 RepID=UPI00202CC3A5|nr:chemotaxis protein CheW [Geomonas sp. Red32]MCM0082891.1 chemotaxis protein CheW [Geomonas sp. Red32]
MSAKEPDSNDLSRFNQAFFEECAEHLAEMERILVSLGDREPDRDQWDAVFRAAHSIKGGAGIFGFDDMTVVTHALESLLDLLRNREIPYRTSMVDLFLEAGDAISMQLAGHRDGKAVDRQAVEAVTAKLEQALLRESSPRELPAAGVTAPAPPPSLQPIPYRVIFSPPADLFARGVRIEGLIEELSELAEPGSFRCRAELTGIPPFDGLDPERCLTRWHFTLTTPAGEDAIHDVFMFAAEEHELEVIRLAGEEVSPSPAIAAALAAPPPVTTAARERGDGPGARPAAEPDNSIRVKTGKVDQLINQVGELLITQSMLSQMSATLDPVLHERLLACVLQLERNARDLQGSVISMRLVPISTVFNRFPRMVREIAAKLGKNVELKLVGEGTELDRGLIEKIADPLSHLVRNALDHGMESPEERAAAGKPATGTLTLAASQVGGRILIQVSEDGRGLDRERILAKAAQSGIPVSETLTDEEVCQLIFLPGFSTAAQVTDLSGRGVGMDVVQRNVLALGGRIQLSSEPGKGTSVTISLPLTLAIVDGLSVSVGEERFIVPVSVMIESLQPSPDQLKMVNGREVVRVRGDYLPILRLHQLFAIDGAVERPERGILMLVAVETERVALLVDALVDELQVVVKSVEANFRHVEGSAGATILGDGKVALILDLSELVLMQRRSIAEAAQAA